VPLANPDRRERADFPAKREKLAALELPENPESLDPLAGLEYLVAVVLTETPGPRDPPEKSVRPDDPDPRAPLDPLDPPDNLATPDQMESRARWARPDLRADPELTECLVYRACPDRRETVVRPALLEEKAPLDPPALKDSAVRTVFRACPVRLDPRAL